MDFEITWQKFLTLLNDDLDQEGGFSEVRPLLAHYTSLQNLENIIANDELWMSNPLLMNDIDEVQFGVINGSQILGNHVGLGLALKTQERFTSFLNSFNRRFLEFRNNSAFDLYVLCFSDHNLNDTDGRLSMWRGYGNDGNGAAIVIDTSRLESRPDSPLILGKVQYKPREEQIEWLKDFADRIVAFISENTIPDTYLDAIAEHTLSRIQLYSILTKHKGFDEEKEWRLVYLKNRDKGLKFEKMFGYNNTAHGIEPKLKLDFTLIKDLISDDFEFSKIIHSIILGPSSSSQLSYMSTERMLRSLGKEDLANILKSSTIPFRP